MIKFKKSFAKYKDPNGNMLDLGILFGMGNFVTPQMFGAKGDNVTDDTEAFKECFKNMNIHIPAGNYIINDTIEVLPGTRVFGDGSSITRIQLKGEIAFNVQEYAEFTDMAIYGNNENTGIKFPSTNLRLNNVRFRYLKYGVYSESANVLQNSFVDCSFLTVKYPLYFSLANPVNTIIISNCEFHTYNVALTAKGTIYATNFDRCIFQGGAVDNYVIDAVEFASVAFSSCYYENFGELITDNARRGVISIRDTWIYKKGTAFLSKETTCNLIVKFVDSTIVNSNYADDPCVITVDGTNLNVYIVNCITKDSIGTTQLLPITTEDIASEYGVAMNCTVGVA